MRGARFERALEGSRDMATNRGFRMHNGAMYTYEQRKLGLSAVLRQALGVAGRHPHGADRVSPVNHQPRRHSCAAHPTEHGPSLAYPTMGRGRSGGTTSSMTALARHPKRYVLNMRWGVSVSNPPVVTPYQAVLPSAPHEQTRASVHRTGSKPRASPAS